MAPTEVILVFDDDLDLELNTLHHHRVPDDVLPQLVRDYRLEVRSALGHGWTVVASETANRWRRRLHRLDSPEPIEALRLVVDATNALRRRGSSR